MKPLLEHYLQTENLSFKYARGQSAREGKEIHPFHEILFYVNGDADFISEQERLTLPRESLILIPKETFHQFTFRHPELYERYVFNFQLSPEIKGVADHFLQGVSILHPTAPHISGLCRRLREACSENLTEDEKALLLRSVFSQLLIEISLLKSQLSFPKDRHANSFISRVLSYINNHCFEAITLQQISRAMDVSPSSLAHLFKEEFGISVYQYITEKRLVHAHRLISEGVSPSQACLKSGYNDYSAFYRAYRRMFGKAPSA